MTGSGTLLDPYVIWDVNDLQNMNLDLTAYYELGQDIDASVTVGWNGGLGFIPVGTYTWGVPANAFRGNFDGKGYKITGLTINRPLQNYIGLFGYTGLVGGYGGAAREMKDVGLENVSITGASEVGGLIGFNDHARSISNCWIIGNIVISDSAALQVLGGGLTGYCDGATSDCYFSGTITITDTVGRRFRQIGGLIGLIGGGPGITRCYSTGTITLTGIAVSDFLEFGGFAGIHSGGHLSHCFSAMDITAVGDWIQWIGGFIGENGWSVSDCYSRGDITVNGVLPLVENIAGFAGYNGDDIDNCYSTGLITTNGTAHIGGFCGEDGGAITDCFWDTDTSGILISDGGTGLPTAPMKDSATFIAVGWDFGVIWGMTGLCNDGYPCLLGVTPGCVWAPPPPPPPPPVLAAVITLPATGVT